MKKLIFSFILTSLAVTMFAQDEEQPTKDKPVSGGIECGYLIDDQTTYIAPEKTLEMVIQHKFGTFENGKKDIWGIYAPAANVRLSLDYVPYKNVQVGYGLTRTNLSHDINAKWTIFQQTKKNTIPVGVALFGDVAIDARPDEVFGKDYSFNGRLSYFGEVIISRKINDRIALNVGGSFSHFNMVDTATMDYDRIGIHVNGRVQVTSTGAIIFNYDQPLNALKLTGHEDIDLHPNLAFGYEINTGAHIFNIYMSHTTNLLNQDIMVTNQRDFKFKQFVIGFTITRLWGF